ncbi:unnamed protein product [Boreogadus saida]
MAELVYCTAQPLLLAPILASSSSDVPTPHELTPGVVPYRPAPPVPPCPADEVGNYHNFHPQERIEGVQRRRVQSLVKGKNQGPLTVYPVAPRTDKQVCTNCPGLSQLPTATLYLQHTAP